MFCEGGKTSRSDTGDIDMLLKRSVDGGKTFSDAQVIWDDGPNTCGNPCPVVTEPAAGNPSATPPTRLIFDTDMGNDIDDALALGVIHALQSREECELAGRHAEQGQSPTAARSSIW